ncbi:hypothetical protein [uncultured Pseudoramibacter sp.]|uniref:hypothetical protein n=1 Tax=uncultured Pseudoramibacter sp. TaxID=1623493 RepID=UPI0025E5EAAA|nr:hypothetical protein [uncultured Pseudoramibacter sp.]
MKESLSADEIQRLVARVRALSDKTEARLAKNPYNFFYQGKSVAYAEVLRVLEKRLAAARGTEREEE